MRFRASAAIVAVAVANVTVAGCGGGTSVPIAGPESSSVEAAGSDPMNDAGAENPQAFVFESGILEIGDFDPYTLGVDIFDPCTEITPEEFAAAGFERVEPLPEDLQGLARGLSVCQVFGPDGLIVADFSNNNANQHKIADQVRIYDDFSSTILPSLFTYGPKNGTARGCFAQIDTNRGGLSAGLPGGMNDDLLTTCNAAISMLEDLYLANSRQG